MQRRSFLFTSAAAALSANYLSAANARLPIRKAVEYDMLPRTLDVHARFALAKECGFECIEVGTQPDERVAEEIKRASDAVKLPIHSVMNMDHWKYPLSDPDPAVVAKSLKGIETSIANAKLWGAATVLVVPAVVNAKVGYGEAWKRSQEAIRKVLPVAEQAKVILGIEEVWNKFLLSPLEFAHYVDEFKTPWVRAYFDVGNVLLYGYPQDWIRTLGKRIVKLHLKDFTFRRDAKLGKNVADWVNLRDGDIDWKAIHAALTEIGYQGDATVELAGGDGAYLKDVCTRFDAILQGV